MSPPPNAPGIARQSSSIGALTHSAPTTHPPHRAGESSSSTTASTATAAFKRLGMSCVSASMSAMLSSTPQSASAASPCHRMPNSPSASAYAAPNRQRQPSASTPPSSSTAR